jgi:hypothetical protein
MFSIFKRKQQYVNVFMSIIYSNKDNILIQRHGISKVKWPIFPYELQDIADELAMKDVWNGNSNCDSNVVITSLCIVSDVYE